MAAEPRTIGRYALFREIASGGMASVHLARLSGPIGFSRPVAIKRPHAQLAQQRSFVAMFVDEARLAARVRHPNVVPILDVIVEDDEILLVMEYVHGVPLSRLLEASRHAAEPIELEIAAAIMSATLHGLHAAHEAKNERGEPLGLVHRDVSPQNILVGADGVARVVDFGIAKAADRIHQSQLGVVKGKLAYLAPEQLGEGVVDRRTDVYSAAVVLWETIAGQRLFRHAQAPDLIEAIRRGPVPSPVSVRPDVPAALTAVVMRGLARDLDERFGSAWDMAVALEECTTLANTRQVGQWVRRIVDDDLEERAQWLAAMEASAPATDPELPETLSTTDRPGEPTAPALPVGRAGDRKAGALAALGATEVMPPTASGQTATEPLDHAPAGASPPSLEGATPAGATLSSASASERDATRGMDGRRPWHRSVAVGVGVGAVALLVVLLALDRAAETSATSPAVDTQQSVPEVWSRAARLAAASRSAARARPAFTIPQWSSTPPDASEGQVGQPPSGQSPGHASPQPPPARDSCSPPFRVDSAGVRIPKPHCF